LSQRLTSLEATKKALPNVTGAENYGISIRDDDQVDRKFHDDIRKNYAQWWARTR
jgi:hypothetical protein